MKYDFHSIIDRRGKDATAFDGIGSYVWGFEPEAAKPGYDEIPMWVADMNFKTAPAVTKALEERIRHPLYGYFTPSDLYYQRIIDWQRDLHGYGALPGFGADMIGYENGVHGCIVSCLNALTEPGDPVFFHAPAYVGFLHDMRDTDRRPVLSLLKKDDRGIWRMDYEDMDRKIRENRVRVAIFCSPHNPSGRVWERTEIEEAMRIFADNHVTVISDEIWSDIVFEGHEHIPTCLLSEDASKRTIGIYAPSKTFNLAGLIGSYHIIPNPVLREKIRNHGLKTHYNDMNVLSMHALIGAYSHEGREWHNELMQVLEKNCRYATDYINQKLPGCQASMPEGTYMIFMECGAYLDKYNMSLDQILKKGWDVGVAYEDGRAFAFDKAIRLNVALPMKKVEEAMDRLARYVFTDVQKTVGVKSKAFF